MEFERTSTAHLTDFAETAALIACLDFVITVDTGIAISRARLRVRPGYSSVTRPMIAGCSIAMTVPGIRTRLFRQTAGQLRTCQAL